MDILKSVRTILGCFFVLSAAFLVSCGLDEPDEPDFFSQSIRYDYDRFPEPETEFFQVNSNGNLVSIPVGIPFGAGEDSTAVADAFFASVDSVYKATEEGTLANEAVLKDAFNYAKTNNKKVHFIGLVSDGGVHSHINHLKGLLTASNEAGLKDVYVHAFTDGRDTELRLLLM